MSVFTLGPVASVSEKSGKGYKLDIDGKPLSLMVIAHPDIDGGIAAYINRCPHRGIELNWMPDRFMDLTKEFIQCAMHGAQFRVSDGLCVSGPCVGQTLEPVDIEVIDGVMQLTNPEVYR